MYLSSLTLIFLQRNQKQMSNPRFDQFLTYLIKNEQLLIMWLIHLNLIDVRGFNLI